MSEYHGCGDGGCVFGHPGGMHTNGGCICLKGIARYDGPDTMQRVRKGIRSLQGEVTALRAALDQERADNERLREYAEHTSGFRGCATRAESFARYKGEPAVCTCGLSALLSGRGEGS